MPAAVAGCEKHWATAALADAVGDNDAQPAKFPVRGRAPPAEAGVGLAAPRASVPSSRARAASTAADGRRCTVSATEVPAATLAAHEDASAALQGATCNSVAHTATTPALDKCKSPVKFPIQGRAPPAEVGVGLTAPHASIPSSHIRAAADDGRRTVLATEVPAATLAADKDASAETLGATCSVKFPVRGRAPPAEVGVGLTAPHASTPLPRAHAARAAAGDRRCPVHATDVPAAILAGNGDASVAMLGATCTRKLVN